MRTQSQTKNIESLQLIIINLFFFKQGKHISKEPRTIFLTQIHPVAECATVESRPLAIASSRANFYHWAIRNLQLITI